MDEKKSHKTSALVKWLIAVLVVILILAGVRLALQSNWLLDYARDFAVEQANNQLNGSLSIGEIRGDLLYDLTITDISVRDLDQQEIIRIDTARVNYTIWDLAFSPHRLDLLRLSGVEVNLVQNQDSVWNVETLIPEPEEVDEEETDPLYAILDRLSLNDVNINIDSELLLPDRYLKLHNFSMQAGAEFLEEGWFGYVENLNLQIIEGRLPNPIAVSMSGAAVEDLVTLESLVINTGRTMLQSRAVYNVEDSAEGDATLSPLDWRDLDAYLDNLPLQQDLRMELRFGGNLDNLNLSLNVNGQGVEQLNISLTADVSDPYILKEMNVDVQNLDVTQLTGLEDMPSFGSVSLQGTGSVNLSEPESASWSGDFRVEEISAADQRLNLVSMNYSLDEGAASIDGFIRKEGEQINLAANGTRIFEEIPAWNADIRSTNLNLATWLDDPEMDSDLTLNISVEGEGTGIDNLFTNVDMSVTEGRFGTQSFSEFRFDGSVTPTNIVGEMLAVLEESELQGEFSIAEWTADRPEYDFELILSRFNIAELDGVEDFTSFINGSLSGSGRSFDIENLRLDAVASFDSSFVNGEQIETLRAEFSIRDQFLTVENALLESPIADADVSLYQNILDLQHPDNTLEFSAQIKELMTLAPLFEVERLESEGEVRGRMARNANNIPEFNAELNFRETFVDTLFMADEIIGNVRVLLLDELAVSGGVNILKPVVNGIEVENIQVDASAILKEIETTGRFGFEIINDENSRISHAGEYVLDEDQNLLFTTTVLEFETDLRLLTLANSFNIRYTNEVLSVDTLQIQSDDETAFLKLWAPHVDSLRQDIGLNAGNLNVGAMFRTFVNQDVFEANLSGQIQVHNSPDSLYFSANGLLEEIRIENGEMDTFSFSVLLENEWLEMELESIHEQKSLFQVNATVPFILDNPQTFDDQFFDRSISGSIILRDTDIGYWLSFVPIRFEDAPTGTVSFDGTVAGEAGRPEFEGYFELRDADLSGVEVDYFRTAMMYDHERGEFAVEGDLESLQRRILTYNASVPFRVDLREFEILLPSDDDSVKVNIESRDFDLAIFNDFVDRNTFRGVGGRMNGDVSISGPMADLELNGYIQLNNGTMRVMDAGINLTDISSRINFRKDNVQLQQFSMRSGPGRLRASGNVAIDNLSAGEIDIAVRAEQFRAANTSDYNATIDLDTRITGTMDEPLLRGSLSILNGFVFLQNFGDRAVEDVRLDDEEEEVVQMTFYDDLAIEMTINFRRQFFIRNRQFLDMEIELGGEVDLVKERNAELEMFGQVEGVRGYARPLGRNFEIDEATVTFSGPVDNPELNVRTVYEPPQRQTEVRIFYIIEGLAQNPSFRFESEPQMELEDIIGYTVFGKPFYELESWEQIVAGNGGGPTAADVAMDVLLDRVEMLAAQRLGIDVVQIDNTRSGSNSSTSITTGWYLNRRTFFALVNEIDTNPKTLFILEYLLTNNLELILTQGDDSRQGIDLRWQYDY